MFKSVAFVILVIIPIVHLAGFDDDMLLFWRRSNNNNPAQPEDKCKPFTSYVEGCNKCVCSAEGVPYCTKMACFKKPVFKTRLFSQVEPNMALYLTNGVGLNTENP